MSILQQTRSRGITSLSVLNEVSLPVAILAKQQVSHKIIAPAGISPKLQALVGRKKLHVAQMQ